ncbi:MAG: SDR family NAD(P)-dependent oxidoreductase [Phycisphaerae bacterium]|nr:SDR family NAD(P)-dependent oxidoreductase [Phycisphaerae bacterium]
MKVAIITGASSGIGMETAFALVRRGYAVMLAARREDRLEQVAQRCREISAGAAADVAVTDVSDRKAVERLVDGTIEKFGRVDVMVNNAGGGMFGRVHELPESEVRDLFDVNFYGVLYGCQAVAPIMVAQRSGHIFNVSSVIGKRGTPFHGAYCASKFAVCGLTDSMRVEMKPYGVKVTNVCPTLTATEFFDHSRMAPRAQSKYESPGKMMPASRVGRKIAATVGKSKPELVFSVGGKFLVTLSTIWPRAVDWMMKIYHDDLVKRQKP